MIKQTVLMTLVIVSCAAAQPAPTDALRSSETRYYVLKTDIDPDEAREAALRMTRMAEEYAIRTRDFSGEIRAKFPFFLVHDHELYLKLGGIEGSAGLFNGQALVVNVPEHVDARVWHVLQHEGFHQFAAAVIGGQRPVWVDEGLAEYFGEALFTGDGFVAGVVPQWRLARIRKEFTPDQFKPIEQIMEMSTEQWNSKLSIINYDQGWSMVHFLVHGDGGKYRQALARFILDLGGNQTWQTAWRDNFGDTSGFEQRWRDYWLKSPDDPTADLYAKATVATLTSFLARASAQKQSFQTFDAFAKSARQNSIKISPDQWLPAGLLRDALADADELSRAGARWSILNSQSTPRLACQLKNGARLTGHFNLQNAEATAVAVDESR